MVTVSNERLKTLNILLFIAFLLVIPQIYFYDNYLLGKNNILPYLGIIQGIIYLYNLLVFNSLLKTELDNYNLPRGMHLSIYLLIGYIIIAILVLIPVLLRTGGFFNTIFQVVIPLLNFISLYFIIQLFRMEVEPLRKEIKLIGVTLLASFIFYYLPSVIYGYFSGMNYLIKWVSPIYLIPDLAYIYFYNAVIKYRASKNYVAPEDRYTIG